MIRHHRVFGDGDAPLYRVGVSETVFRAQLAFLVHIGCTPVTLADGLERLREGTPGHWVAMTFDDGYADNVLRALPMLQAAGASGTFFLTAGLMDERRAPWWDQIAHMLENTRRERLRIEWDSQGIDLPLGGRDSRRRAMQTLVSSMRVVPAEQDARLRALAAALDVSTPAPCELATWGQATRLAEHEMEVGAHTLTHPFLSLLDDAAQRVEMQGSVDRIAARLGVRVIGLAYPGGDHDGRTVEVARASGLAYAVTTRSGNNAPGADPYTLRRRGLSDGACLAPNGRFSRRLTRAELEGAFDRLRGVNGAA